MGDKNTPSNIEKITKEELISLFEQHFEPNSQILNSSDGKDCVVFIGGTGAGKSTLINHLSRKKLKVINSERERPGATPTGGDIVLEDPDDRTAMAIGNKNVSLTLLPNYIQYQEFLYYDLPGFGDVRSSTFGLLNATFIQQILTKAKSVRIVFVTNYSSIVDNRGFLFTQFRDIALSIIPRDVLESSSCLVVTGSIHYDLNKLITKITDKCGEKNLSPWLEKENICQMQRPFNDLVDEENKDYEGIVEVLKKIDAKKVELNMDGIFTYKEREQINLLYKKELQEILELCVQEIKVDDISSLSLEELKSLRDKFNSISEKVDLKVKESKVLNILIPISQSIFSVALGDAKIQQRGDYEALEIEKVIKIKEKKEMIKSRVQELNKDVNNFFKQSIINWTNSYGLHEIAKTRRIYFFLKNNTLHTYELFITNSKSFHGSFQIINYDKFNDHENFFSTLEQEEKTNLFDEVCQTLENARNDLINKLSQTCINKLNDDVSNFRNDVCNWSSSNAHSNINGVINVYNHLSKVFFSDYQSFFRDIISFLNSYNISDRSKFQAHKDFFMALSQEENDKLFRNYIGSWCNILKCSIPQTIGSYYSRHVSHHSSRQIAIGEYRGIAREWDTWTDKWIWVPFKGKKTIARVNEVHHIEWYEGSIMADEYCERTVIRYGSGSVSDTVGSWIRQKTYDKENWRGEKNGAAHAYRKIY